MGKTYFPFPTFPRKEIMQEHAAKIGAIIQLQVTRPVAKWKGGPAPFHFRRYVPVAKPQLLLDILPRIPPRQNHTFEIIQKRKPCKICMDFDNAAGLPTGFRDRGDFTARVQEALGAIMQAVYFQKLGVAIVHKFYP